MITGYSVALGPARCEIARQAYPFLLDPKQNGEQVEGS